MQQLDSGRNIDAGVQYRMPTSSYVCPDLAIRERQEFFQNHPQLIGLSNDLPAVERDGLLWVHPRIDGHLDVDELLGDLAAELASFNMSTHLYAGQKTIDMKLNWKFANDTFGETYHFGKLHKNTLGQLYYGNNLHLREFGRHHRFVTANKGIDALRALPESEWDIAKGTFVLYHLFPNIQLIADTNSVTLIRIYPGSTPGQSITRVGFYYSPQVMEVVKERSGQTVEPEDVYNYELRSSGDPVGGLEASMEVFRSTIEYEDYAMGEMQQRAAENGMLKEIIFGKNEPALHHFHRNYREALGIPRLRQSNNFGIYPLGVYPQCGICASN